LKNTQTSKKTTKFAEDLGKTYIDNSKTVAESDIFIKNSNIGLSTATVRSRTQYENEDDIESSMSE